MGCLHSKKSFVVNEDIQGQDTAAQEIFDTLGLSKNDVDLLYTAFWDIDANSSGTIRPVELFSYFEVESTSFERAIFTFFDEDKSGLINFMEFVCSLWNLLTLPEPDLGSIAYLIKDPTGASALKFSDVRSLLEIIHKKNVETDPSLLTIYMKLKKDYSAQLTLTEFCRWTQSNPSVTTPLMILQLHLRLQIIGESFWVRMTSERRAHEEMGRLDFIKKLQADVMRKNMAYKKRLEWIEKERQLVERRGLHKNGDARDNVTRKESILLGYFRMKDRGFTFRESFRRRFSMNSHKTAPAPPQGPVAYGDNQDATSSDDKALLAGGGNNNHQQQQQQEKPRARRSFLTKPNIVREKPKKEKKHKKHRDKGGSEFSALPADSAGTAQSTSSESDRNNSKKKPQPTHSGKKEKGGAH